MSLSKKKQFFTKVLNLHDKNVNQKQIALQLGLSQKTVGHWLKDIKQLKIANTERLKELEDKLKGLLQDKQCSTEDIKNITIAIANLENRWFNKLNK